MFYMTYRQITILIIGHKNSGSTIHDYIIGYVIDNHVVKYALLCRQQ